MPMTSDTTTQTQPTVYLETFGCQMNVLDTQLVTGQLRGLGYRFIDDWQQADIVLYNTCSVREHAENKVYSRIGIVGQFKKTTNPNLLLGVIGCMAQRDGKDIYRRYPQIDLLCGPGELDQLPMLIDNAHRTAATHRQPSKRQDTTALSGDNHRRSSTLAAASDQLELLDLSRSFSPDQHHGSAYVRITRGCNKFCTYCVVPNTRGAEVHRPPAHIIDECKKLVDSGVVEITLLGQTVNHYHYDQALAVTVNGITQPQVGAIVNHASKQQTDATLTTPAKSATLAMATSVLASRPSLSSTSFADLLVAIHEQVPALQRLRFVTSFPRDFGDDILLAMRDHPRLCRYLHLPVQSGSDRILKLMNRGYTAAMYDELLSRIHHFLPDATIASDLICGFPTETDEDHQATCALLKRAGFKNCFIFKYSPRPGTAAIDRFADDVPEATKRLRNQQLLAIQSQVSSDIHQSFVGKTLRVFVESISQKSSQSANAADPSISLGWDTPKQIIQLSGRTDGDLIVLLDGDPALVGSIVNVKIKNAAPLMLFGQLVHENACA